jgi:osmotically-inducible protein OsmY
MSLKNKKTLLALASILSSSFLLNACAPAVVGGGAVVGTALAKEKGISGALSDTQISAQIKMNLYRKDPDLHRRVNVNVQNGEVMLTGTVPNPEEHAEVLQIAWEPAGVKRVIDNIGSGQASVGTYAKDTWITTQLKSTLLFDRDIQSINYSIKTVSGQVYIMGIAQNQTELNKVIEHARNTSGVTKVINYAHIKGSSAL